MTKPVVLSMVRAVVFDLDGTLADTAGIHDGRRTPWDLLSPGVSGAQPNKWAFSQYVNDLPGELIQKGYRVGIATRAPIAYASTAIHLLGIDTEALVAASGVSKAEQLVRLAQRFKVSSSEVLYVGNELADEEAADAAGCQYLDAPWLLDASARLDLHPPIPFSRLRPARVRSQAFQDELALFQDETLLRLRDELHGGFSDQKWHKEFCESAWFEGLTLKQKAAVALLSLVTNPALSHRRDLQCALFDGVGPTFRGCITSHQHAKDGMFQIHPAIVTKAELRNDGELASWYSDALLDVFPPYKKTWRLDGLPSVALVVAERYHSGWGNMLQVAKNYRPQAPGAARMSSGPEPRLNLIDLPSDVLVAYLLWEAEGIPLVPVPSRAPDAQHPAEVSLRIATLIGEQLGRQVLPLISRDAKGSFLVHPHPGQPKSVVLIDDQITTGTSIFQAVKALKEVNIEVDHVLAYSASDSWFAEPPVGKQCGTRAQAEALGVKCPCE